MEDFELSINNITTSNNNITKFCNFDFGIVLNWVKDSTIS